MFSLLTVIMTSAELVNEEPSEHSLAKTSSNAVDLGLEPELQVVEQLAKKLSGATG